MRYRDKLDGVYGGSASDADKRERKAELMAGDARRLRAHDARATGAASTVTTAGSSTPTTPRSACWLPTPNWSPAFERLFEREGRDFTRFYAEVKRLAALPKEQRRATLAAVESKE